MSRRLEGKACLITGAGSGIGRATARSKPLEPIKGIGDHEYDWALNDAAQR